MPHARAPSSSKKHPRKDNAFAEPIPQPRRDHYPVGLNEGHRSIYDLVLKHQVIIPNTVLDWELLERYGFMQEFENLF